MVTHHSKYYHDEVWNTLTHGIGLLFSLIGGVYLISKSWIASSDVDIVAITIYVACAAFVYASSTAYHATRPGQWKDRLQRLDHISIFFMIAGSHMPIILHFFNNADGYIFLSVMWTLVFLGTIFKIFWMGKFEILSLVLYVGMGCMSIYLFPDLYQLMSRGTLGLLILGGALYSLGIIFYCWESLPYHHTIWHLFVVGGSITHFIAIYFICFEF